MHKNLKKLLALTLVVLISLGALSITMAEDTLSPTAVPEPTEAPAATEAPAGTEVPTELTEAPAGTEVPAEPTEAPAGTEVPAEPTEAPAATEVPAEPTEAPAGTEVPAEPTEVPAATEAPAEVTEAPAGTEVPAEPTEAPTEPTEVPAATEAPAEVTEVPAATEVPAEPTEAPAPTEAPSEPTEVPETSAKPTEVPETPAEQPEAEQEKKFTVNADTHIRLAPDGMSVILCTIPAGTEINVLGIEGDWVKVEVDGVTGYIYKDSTDAWVQPEADEEENDECPIKVTIFSSRSAVMQLGETVYLTSKIEGAEGYETLLQWQCDKGNGFENVPGANKDQYSFAASVETLAYSWRLVVYYR